MICAILLASMTAVQANDMKELLGAVSSARLRAGVEKLASFPTRNTLSPTLSEAAEWLAGEYRKIPGMQVEVMKYVAPKSRRVPDDTEVVQVVATLPGTTDRRILVGGHLDSLNLRVDPKTGIAPGANDDASGTILALEAARVLSTRKWRHTMVFVGFTGEEQGLLGATALAARAKAENWQIDAVLNNDTVGSSSNLNGQSDPHRVRVFSEEAETHASRELARFIEWVVRQNMSDFSVKLVLRRDRYGRGGDHTPFANAGFPAIRFIEVHEEYTRQHTPDDLPEHMDWEYLARVTRANVAALATLANAGPQPERVRLANDQSHHATLLWDAEPGVSYRVFWRDTASATWNGSKEAGEASRFTLENINKDDHFFAVGSEGGVPVPPGSP
ncbi:MAG: M20/M25/M40 family metallo-hydrolase [Fimbriimonadaceae bacterium]|nr:MAG: M20/M25/M40 family metallo-hydrolase [Fimbriimonadaceae bacterium]